MRKIVSIIFVVLIALKFAVSCELLNGAADPDYLDKLHDEIKWANAERLTVRVDFPGEWGNSNPSGNISQYIDIRQGLRPFEIEFTPNPAFSFRGWRAYATSSLSVEALGGDWLLNPHLLDNNWRTHENNNPGTNSNVYGLSTMYLQNWTLYNTPPLPDDLFVSPPNTTTTGSDGAGVTPAETQTATWWTNAARGFTAANGWNTDGIATRGYPRLTWELSQ